MSSFEVVQTKSRLKKLCQKSRLFWSWLSFCGFREKNTNTEDFHKAPTELLDLLHPPINALSPNPVLFIGIYVIILRIFGKIYGIVHRH